MLKKLIAWMRCENEASNEVDGTIIRKYGIPTDKAFKCSELIDMFPLNGKLRDEDIIQISHMCEDGKYQTCYIKMKDIKEYISNENN